VSLVVKVCGVRTAASADVCATSGVDFAGLNLVPGVRRAVEVDVARGLVARLGSAQPVGVFRDQAADEIASTAETLGLTWVQLHGGEPPELGRRLSARFRVIRALPCSRLADGGWLAEWAELADVLLVDAARPGAGEAWDWRELAARCEAPGRLAGAPVWLAGGLDPSSVARAIALARPAGVDVASGVEVGGEPDPPRIEEFCRRARAAAWQEAGR